MKALYILFALLVITQCQLLAVSDWKYPSVGISKVYQKPAYNWSTYYDFAVYGWFKIDSKIAQTSQGVLFHLTANQNGQISVNQKIGDYVLGVLYKDKKLSVGTYAGSLVPFYNTNVSVRSQDLDKWAFFYVGYSGALKKVHHRFEFNGVYFTWGAITGVKHNLSSYYNLFVGNQNKYSKFPGQITKVYIHAGTGSYRENNFDSIIPVNPYIPKCPVIYNQCNYLGTSYTLCNNSVNVPLSFPIKSIFLPKGWVINIQLNNGLIAASTSISCVSYNTISSSRSILVYQNP